MPNKGMAPLAQPHVLSTAVSLPSETGVEVGPASPSPLLAAPGWLIRQPVSFLLLQLWGNISPGGCSRRREDANVGSPRLRQHRC